MKESNASMHWIGSVCCSWSQVYFFWNWLTGRLIMRIIVTSIMINFWFDTSVITQCYFKSAWYSLVNESNRKYFLRKSFKAYCKYWNVRIQFWYTKASGEFFWESSIKITSFRLHKRPECTILGCSGVICGPSAELLECRLQNHSV